MIPLQIMNIWMILSSYRCEMLPQWGKQSPAPLISSWLLVCWLWKVSGDDPDSGLCCCHFTSSFISQVPSHVLHGQAALVPLSLPTWEDSRVAHQHKDVSLFRPSMTPIVGPSVTRAFIWDASVWLKEKKKKWKQCLLPFVSGDGDFTTQNTNASWSHSCVCHEAEKSKSKKSEF